MATLQELSEILSAEGDPLREKIRVAALLRINAIIDEVDDTTEPVRRRKRYAQGFIQIQSRDSLRYQPRFEAIFRRAVMANAGAPKANILGATDSAIQIAADAAIAFLSANFPDPVVI